MYKIFTIKYKNNTIQNKKHSTQKHHHTKQKLITTQHNKIQYIQYNMTKIQCKAKQYNVMQ